MPYKWLVLSPSDAGSPYRGGFPGCLFSMGRRLEHRHRPRGMEVHLNSLRYRAGELSGLAHSCVKTGQSGVWLKNPFMDIFLPWANIEEVKFDGTYPKIRAEGRWYRLYGVESSTLDHMRGRESKLKDPLDRALVDLDRALVDARAGSRSQSRIVKRPSVLDPWFLLLCGIAFGYVAWAVIAYYQTVPSS